jgi:hypothetical protein
LRRRKVFGAEQGRPARKIDQLLPNECQGIRVHAISGFDGADLRDSLRHGLAALVDSGHGRLLKDAC